MKLRFGHVQVDHLQIGHWSEADCAMADWLRRWCKTAQGQIQWQTRKSRYKSYLHKGTLGNCGWERVFWATDLEECKTADLVRESKRRFGLVVRLKAIDHYKRFFCYLSFLPLPSVFSLSSLNRHQVPLRQICRSHRT